LFGVPWLAIISISVVLVSWFILRRTVLGTWIYAVGGNLEAARLTGIKVPLVLLFVSSMSGLLSGLGGAMSAARLFAANGLQLGQAYELDAIAAVILGGTSFVGGVGSIWGTLIGALIIAVLSNGLILVGVSDIWQYIIKGLVIIAAVALDRYRLQGVSRTCLMVQHRFPTGPTAPEAHSRERGGYVHAYRQEPALRCRSGIHDGRLGHGEGSQQHRHLGGPAGQSVLRGDDQGHRGSRQGDQSGREDHLGLGGL